MLSHLVGAANRADIRRLAALEEENATLRTKMERQQERLREAVASRDATIRQLGGLAANHVRDTVQLGDDDALAGLRHLVADLQAHLTRETDARTRLECRVRDVAAVAKLSEQNAGAAIAERDLLQCELTALERYRDDRKVAKESRKLPAERILYVDGRPGCLEQARECMRAAKSELLCHDGGRHDHPSLLAGLISQADRVAFPVDCVSHDAALTVKRLCRQLGKPWLPLRSSGLASFLAAVGDYANQANVLQADHIE